MGPERRSMVMRDEERRNTAYRESVSYTHLDVYKRQRQQGAAGDGDDQSHKDQHGGHRCGGG